LINIVSPNLNLFINAELKVIPLIRHVCPHTGQMESHRIYQTMAKSTKYLGHSQNRVSRGFLEH